MRPNETSFHCLDLSDSHRVQFPQFPFLIVCRLKDRPVNWRETHLGLRWRFICICLFLVILFSQRENEATREQKKKSPYISYLSLYGSFRSTTKTRCLLGGAHMLTSQSFKFSIQSESLTDPKVKNRNENELCRIAKTLLASFSLDHYCHVIFIAFPLCWSYLLLTGSRKFPDWHF